MNKTVSTKTNDKRSNILFLISDQLRFDTIAALGNSRIHTPNIDRLVRRGISFSNAYSPCPVCVPARYNIRTGCESSKTLSFSLCPLQTRDDMPQTMEGRCGDYLARTLKDAGYRTFHVGKTHTHPWNEDIGYETHLYSEELYEVEGQREGDHYAQWLAKEHPEYSHIEQPHGERSEMYYIPQMSPLPAECTVEAWVMRESIKLIKKNNDRPWFGFVSFIGPHPPLAPPVPFNRIYNPLNMPSPVRGDKTIDLLDDIIRWDSHVMWAEQISDLQIKLLYSRYYGEITYIDKCIGNILDTLEATGQDENTLICLSSDHGDLMGDHHGWQKRCFFESSVKIPFLLSQPGVLPENTINDELISLTDLFGIATKTAGCIDVRDGIDVI